MFKRGIIKFDSVLCNVTHREDRFKIWPFVRLQDLRDPLVVKIANGCKTGAPGGGGRGLASFLL